VPDAALSTKKIPTRERLIVALDVDTHEEAKALVERLGDACWFYKLGLQLFMAGNHLDLIAWLRAQGKNVFVDLKLFDIPETVAKAVTRMRDCGAQFATVHGTDAILEAAGGVDRSASGLRILGVTVLTSLDRGDLDDLGFPEKMTLEELVLSRARRALAHGCDGVISSGLEAAALRAELGEKLLIVSPGIRPVDNRADADQKRVMTPERALRSGADYLVVGRPIRDAGNPYEAAMCIQKTLHAVFGQASEASGSSSS
jgi:orotidine-5'-phosphate decarboxylase